MAEQVDILIIGGGLTGATLMHALAGKGFSTRLVEANALTDKITPDFDSRTLALSPASVQILRMLAIWPLLTEKATPINRIHVSEQGRFGRACMHHTPPDSLGFVVEMPAINAAILHSLDQRCVMTPAKLVALDAQSGEAIVHHQQTEHRIKAKLIVAADGAQSTVRQFAGLDVKIKTYQQEAIITNIGLTRSHNNIAYERFTPSGPLAMLPMSDHRMSLVWALHPEQAASLMALPDAAFLKALQAGFGYRLGRFHQLGKRFLYPLKQAIMPKKIAWPMVFIGNAAHTLHPVAGQGFNLGLRDVATLAQCVIEFGLNADMLKYYQSQRDYDQKTISQLTDGLVDLFTHPMPGLGGLKSLGLIAMDNSAGLKKLLMHHASGFGGISPDLVCGIPLRGEE